MRLLHGLLYSSESPFIFYLYYPLVKNCGSTDLYDQKIIQVMVLSFV